MIWFVFQILAFLVWVTLASIIACPLFWYNIIRDIILPAKLRRPSARPNHGRPPGSPLPGRGDPLSQPLVRNGAAQEPSEDGEQVAGSGMAEASKEVRPPPPASPAEASFPVDQRLRHFTASGISPPPSPVATSLKSFFTLAPVQSHGHLGGVPRRIILSTVGAFSLLITSILSRAHVKNKQRLIQAIRNRPPGTPVITISNHMSTLDDPLMWGLWGLRSTDPYACRWTLTAEDICFTNPVFAYFFRVGKCIPVKRGGGIHQATMQEAIELVNDGEWLHTFPEGRIMQEKAPLQRLKWGTGSIIARASVQPIILPIGHSGFETVMPEKWLFGRRSIFPLPFRRISIVVGEPFMFDIAALRKVAETAVGEGRAAPSSSDSPTAQDLGRGGAFTGEVEGSASATPPEAAHAEETSAEETSPDINGDGEAAGRNLVQSTTIIREAADQLPPDPNLPPLPEALRQQKAKAAKGPNAETTVDIDDPEKARAKKREDAGDETTRWLYAHLTEHMRRRLSEVVVQAHELNNS